MEGKGRLLAMDVEEEWEAGELLNALRRAGAQ